jgi:hypothetical protein
MHLDSYLACTGVAGKEALFLSAIASEKLDGTQSALTRQPYPLNVARRGMPPEGECSPNPPPPEVHELPSRACRGSQRTVVTPLKRRSEGESQAYQIHLQSALRMMQVLFRLLSTGIGTERITTADVSH